MQPKIESWQDFREKKEPTSLDTLLISTYYYAKRLGFLQNLEFSVAINFLENWIFFSL